MSESTPNFPVSAPPKRTPPISERRFQLLIESARDYAIFSFDSSRNVDFWSSGAERLFGYAEADILGRTADVLFTPEDRAAGIPQKEIAEALRNGRAGDERWHLRKDQSRFYASGLVFPLRDEAERLLGFVKIARDLTESKLAAEQLKQVHESLERRVEERTAALNRSNAELNRALQSLQSEMEQRRQSDALRREIMQRMVTVQEEERRRISRELHDHLGQQVTALSLGLNGLDANDPDRGERIAELRALAEELGQDLHTAAVELRPTALDDVGLAAALSALVQLWMKRHSIPIEFHAAGLEATRLPRDLESALYRIVQEALTNVAKHARATVVSVIVERKPQEIDIIVEDDGEGFEEGGYDGEGRPRLGLLGMNERAAQFAGTVKVESTRGKGTSVYVRIPLKS